MPKIQSKSFVFDKNTLNKAISFDQTEESKELYE